MVRNNGWMNLNGLWEWEPAASSADPIPFGRSLNSTILVPFPVESCLSGIGQPHPKMWYRKVFDVALDTSNRTLLHFGAIDWQSAIWLNRQLLGNNTGGYNHIDFDVTSEITSTKNELIVFVYDPSDAGVQPNGKQRISAITSPSGDTYTPSSGIWQSVWLETAPKALAVERLRLTPTTQQITVDVQVFPSVHVTNSLVRVNASVFNGDSRIVTVTGNVSESIVIVVPNATTWSPDHPFLYDLEICVFDDRGASDCVMSYFGLRSIELVDEEHPASDRPSAFRLNIDRAGDDLNVSPIIIPEPDYTLCDQLCKNTSGCVTWAYGVPSTSNPSCTLPQPQCW